MLMCCVSCCAAHTQREVLVPAVAQGPVGEARGARPQTAHLRGRLKYGVKQHHLSRSVAWV